MRRKLYNVEDHYPNVMWDYEGITYSELKLLKSNTPIIQPARGNLLTHMDFKYN